MKNAIAIGVFAASTLFGQVSSLKGAYVFDESGLTQTGQAFQTIATIAFDGQGQLQATLYSKGIGSVSRFEARGNYAVQGADGTLVLERQVADPDSETGTRFESATYQLLKTANGHYQALRTDFGILSEATLAPLAAAAANLKGNFAITERGTDTLNQSYITIGSWVFDGNGNVAATLASRSFGVVASGLFSGRLSPQADGTLDVALAGPATDEGTPSVVLNYKLIPNGSTFELLRIDSGVLAETTVAAK